AANLAGVAVDAALLRWPKLCGIDLDLGVDFGELEHLFEQRPNRALCAGADVVRFSGVTVLQQQEVGADDVANVEEIAGDVEVAGFDHGGPGAVLDGGDLLGES